MAPTQPLSEEAKAERAKKSEERQKKLKGIEAKTIEKEKQKKTAESELRKIETLRDEIGKDD